MRLAKSLRYGVRSGAITPEAITKESNIIGTLRFFGQAAKDASSEWDEFDCAQREIDRVEQGRDAARIRLAQLPIFRKPA